MCVCVCVCVNLGKLRNREVTKLACDCRIDICKYKIEEFHGAATRFRIKTEGLSKVVQLLFLLQTFKRVCGRARVQSAYLRVCSFLSKHYDSDSMNTSVPQASVKIPTRQNLKLYHGFADQIL